MQQLQYTNLKFKDVKTIYKNVFKLLIANQYIIHYTQYTVTTLFFGHQSGF